MPSPTMIKWGCIGAIILGLLVWSGVNEIRISRCKLNAAQTAQKAAKAALDATAKSETENVNTIVAQSKSNREIRREIDEQRTALLLSKDSGLRISDCVGADSFERMRRYTNPASSD